LLNDHKKLGIKWQTIADYISQIMTRPSNADTPSLNPWHIKRFLIRFCAIFILPLFVCVFEAILLFVGVPAAESENHCPAIENNLICKLL